MRRRRRGNLITAIPCFLPQLCVCFTDGGESWTLKTLANLPRPVRLTCLPVLPPPRPTHPFHVRKPPFSLFLLHPTLPPQNLDHPLCHVHQVREPCNAQTSRHKVCEIFS